MYPFGYGLSYTTFSYDNLSLSQNTLGKGQTMTIQADITNTGSCDGAEVVQLYVSFPNSAVKHVQSLNRRLVGFERVELKAGEKKTVSIPLSHEQLAYFNDATHTFDVEGGMVSLYVSASSDDDRLTGTVNAVGGTVKQTYLSEETPTAIHDVDSRERQLCQRVYNIQGTCVGTLATIDTLPCGMYVAGGKKYVVK